MDKMIIRIIDNFIPLTWLIFLLYIDSIDTNYRLVAFLIIQVLLAIAFFIFAYRLEIAGLILDDMIAKGHGKNHYFRELYQPWRDNLHWLIIKIGIFVFIILIIALRYLRLM